MRLLLAIIDWINRAAAGSGWSSKLSNTPADDPWVLQQIEEFERELKE